MNRLITEEERLPRCIDLSDSSFELFPAWLLVENSLSDLRVLNSGEAFSLHLGARMDA